MSAAGLLGSTFADVGSDARLGDNQSVVPRGAAASCYVAVVWLIVASTWPWFIESPALSTDPLAVTVDETVAVTTVAVRAGAEAPSGRSARPTIAHKNRTIAKKRARLIHMRQRFMPLLPMPPDHQRGVTLTASGSGCIEPRGCASSKPLPHPLSLGEIQHQEKCALNYNRSPIPGSHP